jgi:phage gp29-like protein
MRRKREREMKRMRTGGRAEVGWLDGWLVGTWEGNGTGATYRDGLVGSLVWPGVFLKCGLVAEMGLALLLL